MFILLSYNMFDIGYRSQRGLHKIMNVLCQTIEFLYVSRTHN